jgi:GWxTD domain-containing protein
MILLRKVYFFIAFLSFLFIVAAQGTVLPLPQEKKSAREPLSEWSKQWLEEVVPYIITPAEKEVFLSLPNEIERGKFIENFWKKRDPDFRTPENEFKVEYYRRIGFANKFFGASGIAGWRTERGRIYILLGAPTEVQRDFNPASSSGFFQGPKETWQYWGLPNPRLPYNVEFVFVDKFGNGNYVLDNSFQLDNGQTQPFDMSDLTYQFDYMHSIAEAEKNPFDNLDKLKGIITTQVTYNLIPFDFRLFHFKGTAEKTYIPLVIEAPYSSLPSKPIGGKEYFSLNLMINVSDQLGKVVSQKSKDLNFNLEPNQKSAVRNANLQVETSLWLEPGSYGLHLLILDNFSGKIGTIHQMITVPDFRTAELATSDIFLSSETEVKREGLAMLSPESAIERKIILTAKRVFRSSEELNVYLEVYNLALSGERRVNSLSAEYAVLQEGKVLARISLPKTEPSAQKDCRLRTSFRLKNFKPGEYTFSVRIMDENAGKSLSRETTFVISE